VTTERTVEDSTTKNVVTQRTNTEKQEEVQSTSKSVPHETSKPIQSTTKASAVATTGN
jgi:hypothetical protein